MANHMSLLQGERVGLGCRTESFAPLRLKKRDPKPNKHVRAIFMLPRTAGPRAVQLRGSNGAVPEIRHLGRGASLDPHGSLLRAVAPVVLSFSAHHTGPLFGPVVRGGLVRCLKRLLPRLKQITRK